MTKEYEQTQGSLSPEGPTAVLEELGAEQVEKSAAEKPMTTPEFKCGTPYTESLQKEEGHDYWKALLEPLQDNDTAQCKIWEGEVQNILIFASLFSAVVTAFVIESYKDLKPDPTYTTVVLLAQIANRLDANVNGSTTVVVPEGFPVDFSPSSITVNVLWILSLVFSLTTVLIGIIASQWLREHQRHPNHFSVEERFGLLSMRTEMLEKWHIPLFFSSLPVLLEVAFVLFFLGLAIFLYSLGIYRVTIPIIVAISLSLFFLLATTTIPALQILAVHSTRREGNKGIPVPCPYKSSQAHLFRLLVASKLGKSIAQSIGLRIHALARKVTLILAGILSPFRSYLSTMARDRLGLTRSLFPFHHLKYISKKSFDHDILHAGSWVDLDTQWVSLRRDYSYQALTGLNRTPLDGTFQKGFSYGPVFDQLLGIQRLCRQHQTYETILRPAYHCFVECISAEGTLPGEFAFDNEELKWSGEQYYRALVEMLRPENTAVVSDTLPQPPAELVYDEAVLLFVERFLTVPTSFKLELTRRVLNGFFERGITSSRSRTEGDRLPRGFTHKRAETHACLVQTLFQGAEGTIPACSKYFDAFLGNVAIGVVDWTPHQIFGRFFCEVLSYYLLFCSSTSEVNGGTMEKAAAALTDRLHRHGPSGSEKPAAVRKLRWLQIFDFLQAWAIVKAYMLIYSDNQVPIPPDLLILAARFKDLADDVVNYPRTHYSKGVLDIASILWGQPEVDVLAELRDYPRQWQSGLSSLLVPELVVQEDEGEFPPATPVFDIFPNPEEGHSSGSLDDVEELLYEIEGRSEEGSYSGKDEYSRAEGGVGALESTVGRKP